jgi:transposase
MWTRGEWYSRNALRYQSDVTDKEWHVIEPLLPARQARGRPRGWPLREIVNAIFYVVRSGCAWRLLPADLPPWSLF